MKDFKWYRSIGFKIALSVAAAAIVVNGLFGYIKLRIQEDHLNDAILKSATQLSETIKKSIRSDMLENRKEKAYQIMETIAAQKGIEKVRIYSSEGEIIFSTDKKEVGTLVDKKAEACYACHAEAMPLERLAMSERNRIFQGPQGHRILGMINPLYNEPDCYTAPCHFHPEAQKVLGVIDITMSLENVDKDVVVTRNQIILSNILSIIIISAVIIIIFMRFVNKPVKELIKGARKVAEGDLIYTISITSDDEMGYLARSFNGMTASLKRANDEIQELIRSLEKKVDERTKQLRETQYQLLQSEKLAAIGKLAATVAHEINNPLSGVFTYIKLMQRRIEEGHSRESDFAKFNEYLASMGKEVERTRSIVQDLLEFTRQKEPSKQKTNLNRVIEESMNLIKDKVFASGARIEKKFEQLPDVVVDPIQMQQVFINIMTNACEAMEKEGTLTIRSFYRSAEDAVILEFSDTGAGISPENLQKIFEPLFTTKPKGTGLGLAVVYGIISKHEGRIEVESELEKGTLVRIILPAKQRSQKK